MSHESTSTYSPDALSLLKPLFEPCSSAEEDASIQVCTSRSWCNTVLFLQLSIAILLLVYLYCNPEGWRVHASFTTSSLKEEFVHTTEVANSLLDEETPRARARWRFARAALRRESHYTTRKTHLEDDVLTPVEKSMSADFARYLLALRTEPCFCTHRREEVRHRLRQCYVCCVYRAALSLSAAPRVIVRAQANFIRSNTDPALVRPPAYPTERWNNDLTRSNLYRYLFLFQLRDVFIRAIAFSLLSSAASTLFWTLLERESLAVKLGESGFAIGLAVGPIKAFFESARQTITEAQDNFKFYPVTSRTRRDHTEIARSRSRRDRVGARCPRLAEPSRRVCGGLALVTDLSHPRLRGLCHHALARLCASGLLHPGAHPRHRARRRWRARTAVGARVTPICLPALPLPEPRAPSHLPVEACVAAPAADRDIDGAPRPADARGVRRAAPDAKQDARHGARLALMRDPARRCLRCAARNMCDNRARQRRLPAR